jgi:hypothetical protein
MQKTEPLPLPRLDTTIHGTVRNAITRSTRILSEDIRSFSSVQEAVEYWTLWRDIANANLTNIEGLSMGEQSSGQAAAGDST